MAKKLTKLERAIFAKREASPQTANEETASL